VTDIDTYIMWFPTLVPYYFLCLAFLRFKMTKDEALERKAENARELGLDYEPWEKFCDLNCVWTDHHPDCKLAQRTWVGLTDEEIDKAWRSVDYTVPWDQHRIDIARAIEAKLKEKNT